MYTDKNLPTTLISGGKITQDMKISLDNKDTLLQNEKSLPDPMLAMLLQLGAEPLSSGPTEWHRYNKMYTYNI